MKKQFIPLLLLMVSISTVPTIMGMQKIKTMLGINKDQDKTTATTKSAPKKDFDREGFWKKAVDLFKAKYGADNAYTAHAESQLHRVQTLKSHRGGFLSHLTGKHKGKSTEAAAGTTAKRGYGKKKYGAEHKTTKGKSTTTKKHTSKTK